MLALVISSSAPIARGLLRFGRAKSAYAATLVVQPREYRLFGLVDGEEGIDLLWKYTGRLNLVRAG